MFTAPSAFFRSLLDASNGQKGGSTEHRRRFRFPLMTARNLKPRVSLSIPELSVRTRVLALSNRNGSSMENSSGNEADVDRHGFRNRCWSGDARDYRYRQLLLRCSIDCRNVSGP